MENNEGDTMDRLFTPASKVKILKTFIRESGREMSANEVAEKSGIDRSTFSRNIRDLLDLGVITKSETEQNAQYYQFNSSNILSHQLRKIVEYPAITSSNIVPSGNNESVEEYWQNLYEDVLRQEYRREILEALLSIDRMTITVSELAEHISSLKEDKDYSAHNLVAASVLDEFEKFAIISRIPKVANPETKTIYIIKPICNWLEGNIGFWPDPPSGQAQDIITYVNNISSSNNSVPLESVLYSIVTSHAVLESPNILISVGSPERETEDPWSDSYMDYLIEGEIQAQSIEISDSKALVQHVRHFLTSLVAAAWGPNDQLCLDDRINTLNKMEGEVNANISIDELLGVPSVDYIPLEVFKINIDVAEEGNVIRFKCYFRTRR